MRINVYSQELTEDTEMVSKPGHDDKGQPAVFHGVRLYLHSSDKLHHTAEDDDRSAITFWLPKSERRTELLARTLERLAKQVRSTLQ